MDNFFRVVTYSGMNLFLISTYFDLSNEVSQDIPIKLKGLGGSHP